MVHRNKPGHAEEFSNWSHSNSSFYSEYIVHDSTEVQEGKMLESVFWYHLIPRSTGWHLLFLSHTTAKWKAILKYCIQNYSVSGQRIYKGNHFCFDKKALWEPISLGWGVGKRQLQATVHHPWAHLEEVAAIKALYLHVCLLPAWACFISICLCWGVRSGRANGD